MSSQINSMMLKDRIALVTGASGSIGQAVSKKLASEGAHVILVGRTIAALEQIDDEISSLGGTTTIVQLDLREVDKIDLLASSIKSRFEKLDILVGNAAVMGSLSPLVDYSYENWDNIISTNLSANWRLIRSFDPLLKNSDSGRVVFMTSTVVKFHNQSFWGPYAVSKSALETLVRIYAAESEHSSLKVNMIDPGPIDTETYRKAFPGKELPDLEHSLSNVVELFMKLVSPSCMWTGNCHQAQF